MIPKQRERMTKEKDRGLNNITVVATIVAIGAMAMIPLGIWWFGESLLRNFSSDEMHRLFKTIP